MKVEHAAFNDYFNRNGATVYFPKQDISRAIRNREIVPDKTGRLKSHFQNIPKIKSIEIIKIIVTTR